MSISTVITMGYGSFGGINYLPTIGYSIGNVAPIVNGPLSIGGPFKAKVLKNNYDRPILSEHAEMLRKRRQDQEDEDYFFLFM